MWDYGEINVISLMAVASVDKSYAVKASIANTHTNTP